MIMFRPGVVTVAIILVVALTVGLGAVLVANEIRSSEAEKREREFINEITELNIKKAELHNEYSSIRDNIQVKIPCGANATIIFLEVDSPLYDVVFPMTGQSSLLLSGTMCLSAEQLPGDEGKITMKQFEEMLAFGWCTAIYYDGKEDLSEYLSSMRALLEARGIEMPNTVFFEYLSYSPDYDKLLVACGIKHAVHHGEGGVPLVDTSINNALLRPGVVGWNAPNQQKNFLEHIYDNKGCAAYSVSFKADITDRYLDVADEEYTDKLGRMMTYIENHSRNNYVSAKGFAKAWESRIEYERIMSDIEAYVEQRRAEIKAELAEIEKRLTEIYRKYNK
nr:hypothetical protein [Clostridia bacterium]